MKIVSWNCQAKPPYNKYGFTKEKAEFIDKYNADIYIIQEATSYDVELLENFKINKAWYGDNIDSIYGIGIFSNKFKIELLTEHNPDFRYVIPYKIFNEKYNFNLFAVWTKDRDKSNKKIEYTEQIWNAINYSNYNGILKSSVLLAGDFNSNNFWNDEYVIKKIPSHNDIIDKLKEYNIESVYHKYFNCENGNENDPTLLLINTVIIAR